MTLSRLFHDCAIPVREHIDQVFAAARILEYGAGEQDVVDRVVMSLQPDVLAHSAFLERPHSRKDLYHVVGIIEKIAVNKERQRNSTGQVATSGDKPLSKQTDRNVPRNPHPPNVGLVVGWAMCNDTVAEILLSRENGQVPGGPRTPGQEH